MFQRNYTIIYITICFKKNYEHDSLNSIAHLKCMHTDFSYVFDNTKPLIKVIHGEDGSNTCFEDMSLTFIVTMLFISLYRSNSKHFG